MPISDKLAVEIVTIVAFHVVALLILFSFNFFVYLKAKKTPLLFSYLAVVGMIMIWIVAKIFKTVAPNETLRWFFIVLQYLGIQFMGFCLIIFAYIYTKEKIPSKKSIFLLAVLPALSYLVVITNPLHMKFYSYYDFYKDSFGSLFYPVQIIQYVYLIIGIVMLAKGFSNQPAFQGKRAWSNIFAMFVLLPLLVNLYYIMFKLDVFNWFFPFSVFDITPIASSISLILFTIPALKFRFFDITPVSYSKLFSDMPSGIVFLDKKNLLYGGNSAFYHMFGISNKIIAIDTFLEHLDFNDIKEKQIIEKSLKSFDEIKIELHLKSDITYKISMNIMKNKERLLCFYDISALNLKHNELIKQNNTLSQINVSLDQMAETMRELVVIKTKAKAAQDMHDILGHSLTVVIGTIELAAAEQNVAEANKKLAYVSELLLCSLKDLKNTLVRNKTDIKQTSLIKNIINLKNENIEVDFTIQGEPFEVDSLTAEALFRLCQESVTNAIKHGKAKTIHIILRYKQTEIEIFTIDNGIGCKTINKNFGLCGIESRIKELSGNVSFGSDGEKGFTIYAVIPRQFYS